MKVFRADGLTNEFTLRQDQKKPPIKVKFTDGVGELAPADIEAFTPWMEQNEFSFEDNRPTPPPAPAPKPSPKKAAPEATAPKPAAKKPAGKKGK